MAFTAYHNISGAVAQDTELIALNDLSNKTVKSIYISNTSASTAATASIYVFKDSTNTSVSETYYLIKNMAVPVGVSLVLDDSSLLGFNNSIFSLYITVGSSDFLDVVIRT